MDKEHLDQLVEYIDNALDGGMSKAEIESTLGQHGWSGTQINEGFVARDRKQVDEVVQTSGGAGEGQSSSTAGQVHPATSGTAATAGPATAAAGQASTLGRQMNSTQSPRLEPRPQAQQPSPQGGHNAQSSQSADPMHIKSSGQSSAQEFGNTNPQNHTQSAQPQSTQGPSQGAGQPFSHQPTQSQAQPHPSDPYHEPTQSEGAATQGGQPAQPQSQPQPGIQANVHFPSQASGQGQSQTPAGQVHPATGGATATAGQPSSQSHSGGMSLHQSIQKGLQSGPRPQSRSLSQQQPLTMPYHRTPAHGASPVSTASIGGEASRFGLRKRPHSKKTPKKEQHQQRALVTRDLRQAKKSSGGHAGLIAFLIVIIIILLLIIAGGYYYLSKQGLLSGIARNTPVTQPTEQQHQTPPAGEGQNQGGQQGQTDTTGTTTATSTQTAIVPNGYEGICKSKSFENYIESKKALSVPGTIVCNDSESGWVLYGKNKKENKYYCYDSAGTKKWIDGPLPGGALSCEEPGASSGQ